MGRRRGSRAGRAARASRAFRARAAVTRTLRRSTGLVWGVVAAAAIVVAIGLATPAGRALVARVLARVEGVPRVTIPEGFSRFEIAARLESRGICEGTAFLDATTDRELLARLHLPDASAEGWLFPDTYDLPRGTPPRELVERFVARFHERSDALFAAHASELAADGRTARDVVVLASIVEREAALADEQPIIAGVFANRLRDPTFTPHRLQSDPTSAYGCLAVTPMPPSCPPRTSARLPRVTHAMTEDALNPYNTYRIEGLPPGAISNPGLGALRAALSPGHHDYLYFVARGHSRHAFSRTLAEHNVHVGELRDHSPAP